MNRKKRCPHCGRVVADDAQFCPHCGFDLSKNICENCFEIVNLEEEICPHCGHELKKKVVVLSHIDNLDDERYKIVEQEENYTILKEEDISLERKKPVDVEHIIYSKQGLFYDIVEIEHEQFPVLSPEFPIYSIEEYWKALELDKKTAFIFEIFNAITKLRTIYISEDYQSILVDAKSRLLVKIAGSERDGYLRPDKWLIKILQNLPVSKESAFSAFLKDVSSKDFDSIINLGKEFFSFFSSYSKVTIHHAVVSSVGLVRTHNEDNYVVSELTRAMYSGIYPMHQYMGLFIVSDGMGGHKKGEVASQMTVSLINEEILMGLVKIRDTSQDMTPLIRRALQRANNTIHTRNKGANSEREKMGATVAGILFIDSVAWYFNVGDSSILLLDDNGLIKLSRDDISSANRKSLTQAIGIMDFEKIEPHISMYTVSGEMKILLCSDGLTDMIKFAEIEDILKKDDINSNATDLLSLALERGGVDNITMIVGKIKKNRLFE